MKKKSTVLVISQVYIPDPASVGQHLHDLCSKLVENEHRVIVYTARRGYDNPKNCYEKFEIIDGVEVHRLPFSSFGKYPIFKRLSGGLFLMLQASLYGMFTGKLKHILVSTAPPFASCFAEVIAALRRAKLVFWAMDLNPDQLIETGKITKDSFIGRIGNIINKSVLKHADCIVALDKYMADRLEAKYPVNDRILTIPPWPYESQLANIRHSDNPFRKKQGFGDKFVVMYSGNISPVHPIDTLLETARRLKDDERFLFLFIGGTGALQEIQKFAATNQLSNIKTLPYLPLDQTKYSLSSADLHVISMGNNMVGVVHPCKIYGVMSVSRPFLAYAPEQCHISDILTEGKIGWRVNHGDVEGGIKVLDEAYRLRQDELIKMGQLAQKMVFEKYSRQYLCSKYCESFED